MRLFVGRERELRTLNEALERAIQGDGSLVLVSGEAGIGKTSLVQALVEEGRASDALVLTGGAYDLMTTPPYGTWLEITDRYRPDDSLPEVPVVLKRGTGVGELQSQIELFDVARDFFRSVSVERPLVLVLEDLQWADQASLDMLRYLARQIADHRILLLATYRDDEITRKHPLFQLLPALVRESDAVRIELRPLDDAAIHELSRCQFELEESALNVLVTYLLQWAEGNPLFTEELLRTLIYDGTLQQIGTGWQLGDLPQSTVPSLIQQVVERRTADLSNAAYEALQIAAVMGHVVPLERWESVAGVDTVTQAAAEVLGSRLVTESGPGHGIVFRHALLREAIYKSLMLTQRQAVHRRVAEVYLEQVNPDADTVAWHLRQAGDSRAADWLIYAGDTAESNLGYREASERYRSAAEILQNKQGEIQTAIGLHLKTGYLLHQFDPEMSTQHFRLARQLALDAGEHAAAGYALVWIGSIRTIVGGPQRGLQEQRDGVREMVDASEHIDPAIVWGIPVASTGEEALHIASNGLAYALAVHGRLQEAIETAERFLDVDWRKAGHEQGVAAVASATINSAQAYHGLAVALSNLGYVEDGRLAFRLIEEIFRIANLNHPIVLQVAMSYLMRQHFTYRMDDLQERESLIARAEEWFEKYAPTIDPVSSLSVHELHLLYSGRWSELHSVKESGDLSPLTPWRTISMSARARLDLYQGDFDSARRTVAKLLPDGPRTRPENHPHWLPGYQVRIAAELALETGEFDAARSWLETHDRWLEWSGALVGRAEGYVLWGRLNLAEDEVETAFDYAQRAISRASNPRQPLALISIHRFHGELYGRSGDLDAAEYHLNQSLELAEACAIPFERALTLLASAELEIARDNREAAVDLLGEVRRTGTDLGARPMLERAEELANQFSPPQDDNCFGLSARELEVLQLLVEGRSNKEIGDELYISPRTAMQHVSSILRKLDVDSRTAAATRAVREGFE